MIGLRYSPISLDNNRSSNLLKIFFIINKTFPSLLIISKAFQIALKTFLHWNDPNLKMASSSLKNCSLLYRIYKTNIYKLKLIHPYKAVGAYCKIKLEYILIGLERNKNLKINLKFAITMNQVTMKGYEPINKHAGLKFGINTSLIIPSF